MSLSDKLKKARLKANLSQNQLAEMLNVNVRTYGSYERGERDVSTSLLRTICQTLNVSSDELLENDISVCINSDDIDSNAKREMDGNRILSSRQHRIVDLFDELTIPQQDNIIGRAEMLAEQNENGYKEEEIG